MKTSWMTTVVVMIAVPGTFLAGCNTLKTSIWRGLANPTALVNSPDDPYIMPIHPTASAADVSEDLPPNATGPTAEDIVHIPQDYRIGPEDVLDISILDLLHDGMETVLRRQVMQSGIIDLPLVSPIRAEGLTSLELRDRIIDAYSPDILRNPTISVSVVIQRQSTFSIGGAVERPGTYNKTRPDMRLLEAINLAGTQTQSNIPYVLVIRTVSSTGKPETAPAVQPADSGIMRNSAAEDLPDLPEGLERPSDVVPEENEFDMPVPSEMRALTAGGGVQLAQATDDMDDLERLMNGDAAEGDAVVSRTTRYVESAQGAAESSQHETSSGPQPTRVPAPVASPADALDWERALGVDSTRVIAIDLKKLRNGSDPRMNIVVRENDIILIPHLEQEEFYMYGEVNRPGVYSLTGRKVTIKMALAAAGGLGPLAWPENATLTRRIGPNEEQTIPVNIEHIMLGKQADFFLKGDDQINVGTNIAAQFMLVFRNAFRMTYGFGFIYDRNFATAAPQGLNSHRFTRW